MHFLTQPTNKNEDNHRLDTMLSSSRENFNTQETIMRTLQTEGDSTLLDEPTAPSQSKIMSMFYNSKDTLRLLS